MARPSRSDGRGERASNSGPEDIPRAAATFELSAAVKPATGDSYFAQHAFVQLAEASQHSAEQPLAAQHSQSAHDVHSHSGQSTGQQQQPPPASKSATLPLAAAGLSSDNPASIAAITITTATSAAKPVRDIGFLPMKMNRRF